jgi:hypothetical protein
VDNKHRVLPISLSHTILILETLTRSLKKSGKMLKQKSNLLRKMAGRQTSLRAIFIPSINDMTGITVLHLTIFVKYNAGAIVHRLKAERNTGAHGEGKVHFDDITDRTRQKGNDQQTTLRQQPK